MKSITVDPSQLKTSNLPPGKSGFYTWLRLQYPQIYHAIFYASPGLGVTSAAPATSWYTSLISSIGQMVPLYQQQQIFKMQLQRAGAGLPPLDTSQVAPPGVPINIGLSKNIEYALIGGIALIAGVILFKKRK